MSVLHNVRARAARAVAPMGSRFEAFLAGLTPRDRKLFYGLLSAVLIVLFGGVGLLMKSSIGDLEGRLLEREQMLVDARELGEVYAQANEQVVSLENDLRRHEGTDLSAYLEQAASTAQIRSNLDSVRESSVSQLGILEQKNYNVDLKKVTLDQLLNFLYETEATGYPLRIQNANIQTVRVSGEKKLTMRMEVAAYRLSEEERGEEG